MESLALFVGLLLLGLLIGGPIALAISFISFRWAKILAIVLAAPITGLGLMLVLSADGSRNVIIIGSIASISAIAAVVNGFSGLKKLNAKPEYAVPMIKED